MSYNFNDLEKGGKHLVNTIEGRLENHSQAKADAFVEKLSRTRGLWVFPHIGGFALIFICVGVGTGVVLKTSSWPIYIGGFVAALMWWKAPFTREHPFWSFIIGGVAAPIALLIFVGK